ncbi:glutathione S-transferase family protein [Cribrihabitans sp. XS_ASV171]
MPVLYYSKGSSALAAHILLEESGAAYVAREVPIPEGAHLDPGFLRTNPKGRIPALATDQGVLTENPAILTYIAERHAPRFLPADPFARARAQEVMAYLCATVHVAFAHGRRGARWSDDPQVIAALKTKVPENLAACASLIERQYLCGPFVFDSYSLCDPYTFLVHRWMAVHGLNLDHFPRLAAHRDAMLDRPATRRAMAAHGL